MNKDDLPKLPSLDELIKRAEKEQKEALEKQVEERQKPSSEERDGLGYKRSGRNYETFKDIVRTTAFLLPFVIGGGMTYKGASGMVNGTIESNELLENNLEAYGLDENHNYKYGRRISPPSELIKQGRKIDESRLFSLVLAVGGLITLGFAKQNWDENH